MSDSTDNNSLNSSPQKTDHWYKASKGDETFLFSIERGTAFSNDLKNQDYYLHIYRGPTSSSNDPSSRTSNFGEALSNESKFKTSLIEQGYKIDKIDLSGKPKTDSQTPTTRTQKDKPEHTDDKPKHQEKEKKQTERPDNKAPEQEGKKVEDPKPNPEVSQNGRGNSDKPSGEKSNNNDSDFDWGALGIGIAKGAAFVGVAALAGAASPFLLAGVIGGGFIYSFMNNVADANRAGAGEGAVGRALLASAPVTSQIISAMELGSESDNDNRIGFNFITGGDFSKEEWTEKLGGEVAGAFGTKQDLDMVKGTAKGIKSFVETNLPPTQSMRGQAPRGYIVLPFGGGESQSTKLSKKLKVKPEEVVYSESIASDKRLKAIKKGQGTGMDSNHLLLAEWFRKGPSHLRGLEDFVPSTLLAGGMEHQGTFHGAFNELMRKEGLFQKSHYSQADIERGMLIAEKFFRNNPGGELGKSWADACKDFRLNIFEKVAK